MIIYNTFGGSRGKLAGWFKVDLYWTLPHYAMDFMAKLDPLFPILKILGIYVYNF